jgi:hypothetical protein
LTPGAVVDRVLTVTRGFEMREPGRRSPFSGRLIGFCGEEPGAFVSILPDGEN